MAKSESVCRYVTAAWLVACAAVAHAAEAAGGGTAWTAVPRVSGRITAAEIGLVINTDDPYSEAVGGYYIEKRRLRPHQVLRVQLPVRAALTPDEFERLHQQVAERFGSRVQALALAWTVPYAVGCNSITGALALGYNGALCRNSCAPSPASRYFNAATAKPYRELGVRPSMLLAASSVQQAKALIDRGVAADRTLGLRGAPPVSAYFVSTADAARNVRARLFPPAGLLRRHGVQVQLAHGEASQRKARVLVYQTGAARVNHLDTLEWVNGALADHLTSFGGLLDRDKGQMTALAWLDAGATASYGTVSEPCNHPQKFPHPQVLLQHYLQGSSALEAYWKSVAWPLQGVFVGEPLAAPFAR
ncbi:MAG: TIGR03790 family protein [Pseudomonadota bacterium]